MGLAQRRAIEDFKANHLPTVTSDIEKLAGTAVPIEVRWDQIAWEAREFEQGTYRYDDIWMKVFFTPVIDALTRIGRDPMGKAALAGGLKKIVVANTVRAYTPEGAMQFDQASSRSITTTVT